MDKHSYDIVVIGAGSGGLTAARTAAQFGVSVALLEKDRIGGDCLHTGCVPSKSIITVARDIQKLSKISQFVDLTVGSVNFSKIHDYVHSKIADIQDDTDNAEALKQLGVDVITGKFSFTDDHTLMDSDSQTSIVFKKCIIATGSTPASAPIPGLDQAGYITSDTIWNLTSLPPSLAIIGAGPIGLELGQAFAMLGTEVTIFERGNKLLERFDDEAGRAIASGLKQSGINVIYNSGVTSISGQEKQKQITYTEGNKSKKLVADSVLLAIGRTPNTGSIGLEGIDITTNDRGGIMIDSKLRTSQKHIYAIGDCVGGPLFTHWAGEQGAAAVIHALIGVASKPNADTLPNATFTAPEIAQLGKSKKQLNAENTTFEEVSIPYSRIDKAIAEGQSGSVQVFLDDKGKILGALIIGANASEIIGYLATLKHNNKRFDSFSGAIQAYPTYTIGLKTLAADEILKRTAKNPFVKLLIKLRGY